MAQMRELMFHFKGTINAENLQKILFHLVMGGYSQGLKMSGSTGNGAARKLLPANPHRKFCYYFIGNF